ncbi:MAG: CARDB domain-containing protein [Candidatus Moraniibacteriota bacterium]
MSSGWCWPTGTSNLGNYLGWHGLNTSNFPGEKHLAKDIDAEENDPVYAIADGRVLIRRTDVSGYGGVRKSGGGMVIRHTAEDGTTFDVLYAHLKDMTVKDTVEYGEIIAEIGPYPYADGTRHDHLHFGVSYPSRDDSSYRGRGTDPIWDGYGVNDEGFYDPLLFLLEEHRINVVRIECHKDAICWQIGESSSKCADGSGWTKDGIVTDNSVCSEVIEGCRWDQGLQIEDTKSDRRWYRSVLDWLVQFWRIERVSAAEVECQTQTYTRYVTVDGAGNIGTDVPVASALGSGARTPAPSVPTLVPPDFITKRTWLTTPWGTETYKYGLNESFNTKAQFENIGEGTCPIKDREPTTIISHFYLSRGYKEDPHSGDGAWRRLDSTTTQCDNLKPGDTHTETKNTVIREWITEPGIYNIVACIDHPQDDHNNGGEHDEKHESNNCSTEAVIEVVEGTVNVPDVDLTPSGFTLLQAPTYAGDFVRLGATITNQGTVNATADIRSAYTVSCNGGSNILLTDDGTMASSLTAGASAWEETLTPVQLPNVVGTCTLSFFTDYQGAQPETDETNNSASLTVTLAPKPPPQPDFIVRAVGPAGGSASIKAGSKFYPAMYVKNVGTAPSPAAIRSSYWFMGPGTGGTWTYITDDGTEASKLCVGCEEREQYDGGMKISARGTYYFKGCADYQSAVTESNEANNCTVSSPITVY